MYNVSIGQRTLVVVFLTTMMLFSILFIASDILYTGDYTELENQSVEENVNRVSEALYLQTMALDTLCHDRACRDDICEFARDRNAGYIENNMGDETFTNTGVNLIAILDSSGQIIYKRAIDLDNLTDISLPQDLQDRLSAAGLLQHSSMQDYASGAFLLDEHPMLIASRPIKTSQGEGLSAGTLIMGRFLESNLIRTISGATNLTITVLPLDYTGYPDELAGQISEPDGNNAAVVQPLSGSSIAGYRLVEEVEGNPAFVLRIDMPRNIYNQGQKASAYLHISLFLICIVFFLVLLFAVNKTVLSRITMLSDRVNRIGSAGDTAGRVSLPGKDELSGLAGNINTMLESIERSESEIRSQKEFIDRVLANTPDAVLVIDSSQKIVLINSAFDTVFGLDSNNLKDRNLGNIKVLEDLSSQAGEFIEGMSAEHRTELQYTGENLRKTLTVSFTRMREEALFLIIVTDITSEKIRQDQIYLTDRLASVGEMASGIAHELNNPLTSIVGLSELLSEEELPGNIIEDVTIINSEAKRAACIVKNMLSFARKHSPTQQTVNIEQIFDDIFKLRSYNWAIHNITVECDIEPELPAIIADYYQMQQVFLNIVLNAEYSMTESHGGGTLVITVRKDEETVKIAFSDDGSGISPESINRIFNPFYTTKEIGSGTGLGLSICYSIVTAHKGCISVQSEPGKGATFIVELPVRSSLNVEASNG